ncbi:hypothetical protein HMPREF1541_07089 [Neofusicoccum parvum]|uniref:Uncharacterized protein n=1 Tax=Neofusicoccum parvum TaxID=310453 RepID=A0ACB5SK06_9PEZI|nr:hypothetical protein HMPREF1541_07089 [Neofusicoccum parvum]
MLLSYLVYQIQYTKHVISNKKLLCPIAETPAIICVGINYKTHAKESSLPIPTYPVIFMKSPNALAGPGDNIPIHQSAQSMLDYEGELTVITSRDAKNLAADYSLSDYVLGYTVGNDVSARNFQLPEASGGQFCYSKSFDGFAPIGPCICSTSEIPNPQALTLTTRVNDGVRQNSTTDDMIWTIKDILRHLSQGTTVKAGTVIMTGTPSGVGYLRKTLLNDGDVVEVEVKGIGTLLNVMRFENSSL